MEAVGQLAGGVAHDFNNLLTAILGNVDFVRTSPEPLQPEALAESLEQIHLAGTRAAEMTRQLLAFSRKDRVTSEVLSLTDLVKKSEGMIRRLLRENILLELQVAPDLPTIQADPTRCEQILLNLVVNAQDAMPGGGRLEMELSQTEIQPSDVKEGGIAGCHVVIEVRDHGEGMDEETKQRLFEPFFTTKEVGTGLGLSTVYGVVSDLRGFIEVESEPGSGTSFRVYLPASTQEVLVATEPEEDAEPPRGTGLVLLCEDEALVRRFAKLALEKWGYEVIEASDGQQALELMSQLNKGVDLLVTDVVMPGMSGPQLARKLRKTAPNLPVLFVSGYAQGELSLDEFSTADFLQKPYTPSALGHRATDLINAQHRSQSATPGPADVIRDDE